MKRRLATALAAAVCGLACNELVLGPTAPQSYPALFDEVWQQFDLHYSFFELKHVNWDSLGAHYRVQALAAPTDLLFSLALSRMLGELRDVHVSLTPGTTGSTMRYLSAADTTPTYFDLRVVAHYVPDLRTTPGGHVKYGALAPAVGYVVIRDFEGTGWASELDSALTHLGSATRLVVDVRDNPGGNYVLAARLAGRFADRSRTYGYVRVRNGPGHGDFTDYSAEVVAPEGVAFRGPVFVLTNRHDFSSAEDFVLAMRVLPSVTLVGDTTAGASGGPIVRELSNGWTYQLSEWIEYTSDHRTFEQIGLAPDVVVKASAANANLGVDGALERALGLAQR